MVMKRFVLNLVFLKNNLQEMHLLYSFDQRSLLTVGDMKTD